MSTPSVSVIVPVYNVEPYLRQCLDSLINQTLHDIEIICVDDGSTDGSPVILQDFAAQDDRIRIITQVNKGVSAARNVGISNAQAPYIMFCDPDDWYELNMCEKMYQAINGADEAAMAICGTEVEYECNVSQKRISLDKKFFSICHSGITPISGEMLLNNFSMAVCSKLYRRSRLLEYNIKFPEGLRYEDVYFFNTYIAHETHIVLIQDKLYHYRRHQNSLMINAFNHKPYVNIDYLRIAMLLWEYYNKHNILEKWERYIVKFWINCLRVCLYRERTKKARKLIVDMARGFIDDSDQNTHTLSESERNEIIKLLNHALSSPATQTLKYKVAKRLINLLPAAAWRRRLRRKYL